MKIVFLFIIVSIIACKGLHAQERGSDGFPVDTTNTSLRITGGFPILITDAPWQVILSLNNELCCGGSIIAPNFILTAKHCVEGLLASSVKVIAGVTCKNEVNSSNTFNVSNIILHPDPNIDAALLQLSNNITYNNNRQRVNYLSSVYNTFYNVGNQVRVSGWGWTIPNNPNSTANCLEAVDLNIISNQDTSNVLRAIWGRDLNAHEMAATGTENIRQGACHCDSGGPLTILTTSNEPVLIGIVQGGIPGCVGNNQNSPYVKVQNGAKLILDAAGEVNIIGDFEVVLGSEFEIR